MRPINQRDPNGLVTTVPRLMTVMAVAVILPGVLILAYTAFHMVGR